MFTNNPDIAREANARRQANALVNMLRSNTYTGWIEQSRTRNHVIVRIETYDGDRFAWISTLHQLESRQLVQRFNLRGTRGVGPLRGFRLTRVGINLATIEAAGRTRAAPICPFCHATLPPGDDAYRAHCLAHHGDGSGSF